MENGYIGFYKGKQHEVYAKTSLEAQNKLAEKLKVKKAYQITVLLCEKKGKEVIHTPSF